MVDNFPEFADLVNAQLRSMSVSGRSFVAGVTGEELYDLYLSSFPPGTNPMFKERTEHDCTCCRHFIKRVGNVVSTGKTVVTIWDTAAKDASEPYRTVAQSLRKLVVDTVHETGVQDLFLTKEYEFGSRKTRSLSDGKALSWNHFYTGDLSRSNWYSPDPVEKRGEYRTSARVFERALNDLRPEAVETVLGLIMDNLLYRGAEYSATVAEFKKLQTKYRKTGTSWVRKTFPWVHAGSRAARIRNTAIGTLLIDLSGSESLEVAVSKYESVVAPANYKRSKALITPAMVKDAMKTVRNLGLESALERRFARLEDISVNDVLWVDSDTAPKMRDSEGIESLLMEAAVQKAPSTDHAIDISIDEFMSDVVPKAVRMEALFDGSLMENLVSLTAPVHPDAGKLFMWDNNFAWSYVGNITDSSIKDRVRNAGGKVSGVDLRCSLSWFNADDLDIHAVEPCGSKIYYGNRRGSGGGELDVDMNVSTSGPEFSRNAVENIVWERVRPGTYAISVNNYTHRESSGVGFVIEVENKEKICHIEYRREVSNKETIPVVEITVDNDGRISDMKTGPGCSLSSESKEKWGIKTGDFVKVNALTLSPNYWNGSQVGNKHTIFVLDGALNDEPTRGIYNEFLSPALSKHRKVFEVIGEKTKCQPTDGQLSGLGFSSTKAGCVMIRVTQADKQRLFNVKFGGR